MIPHARPRFSDAAQREVARLLAAGQVAAGAEVAALERTLCDQVGRAHAVAVDSGTSALSLALRLLAGEREETRVAIPAFACASLLWAVRAAGMVPHPLDCDPDTLTLAPVGDHGCDVVVLAHPFGMVEPQVTRDWGVPVVEDIAQSAGVVWRELPLGSRGTVTVASFHATKPWGGAYGGAVLLDDEAAAARLRAMRDPDGVPEEAGYRGHHLLSDLHALLARLRVVESDAQALRRRTHAARLAAWLEAAGAEICPGFESGNAFRLLVRCGRPARQLVHDFRARGVAASLPIKAPLSRVLGCACPGAEESFGRWVSLPLLADFSDAELATMERAISEVMG